MELSLLQILFVVALTKKKTFWTEVDNGFISISIKNEWVDPKEELK